MEKKRNIGITVKVNTELTKKKRKKKNHYTHYSKKLSMGIKSSKSYNSSCLPENQWLSPEEKRIKSDRIHNWIRKIIAHPLSSAFVFHRNLSKQRPITNAYDVQSLLTTNRNKLSLKHTITQIRFQFKWFSSSPLSSSSSSTSSNDTSRSNKTPPKVCRVLILTLRYDRPSKNNLEFNTSHPQIESIIHNPEFKVVSFYELLRQYNGNLTRQYHPTEKMSSPLYAEIMQFFSKPSSSFFSSYKSSSSKNEWDLDSLEELGKYADKTDLELFYDIPEITKTELSSITFGNLTKRDLNENSCLFHLFVSDVGLQVGSNSFVEVTTNRVCVRKGPDDTLLVRFGFNIYPFDSSDRLYALKTRSEPIDVIEESFKSGTIKACNIISSNNKAVCSE